MLKHSVIKQIIRHVLKGCIGFFIKNLKQQITPFIDYFKIRNTIFVTNFLFVFISI